MTINKEELIAAITNTDDKAAIAFVARLLVELIENQTSIAASLERLAQCVVMPNENYATGSIQTFNRG